MNQLTDIRGTVLAEWDSETYTVGTRPPSGGLTLKDPACAPHHCTIYTEDQGCWIQAEEGRVLLNDNDITREWMNDGDTILLGQTTLVFRRVRPPQESETFNTQLPHFRVQETGQRIPILAPQVTIGSQSADSKIPSIEGLQAEHFLAGITGEGIWFRDLTGQGILYNGTQVAEGWLNQGDTLAAGGKTFQFGPAATSMPPVPPQTSAPPPPPPSCPAGRPTRA